jgi:hypothetical protein
MTATESTWCVHIQGPDDVLPAESRLAAMKAAMALNAASLAEITRVNDDEYYPTMWAVPIRRSDLYTSTSKAV